MATEIVHTIRASGGDYTTLSAWEAAQQRDLVAADEIAVAECYNDWPSGLNDVVEIFGWTTDSTRFVNVRVADGHKHGGQIDAGFRIKSNGGATGCVYNRTSYTLLEDLNVENTFMLSSGHVIYNVQPTTISRCIAKGNNNSFTGAFTIGSSNTTCINCLAVNTKRGFRAYIGTAMDSIQLLNCTSANCSEYGFWVHASVPDITVKNCVSYNAGVTNFSGLYEAASTNNAASDGSTNTPPGSNPLTVDITSADFVDAANGDFRLSAGSQLIDAGTDLSSDFTTDIVGTVRG